MYALHNKKQMPTIKKEEYMKKHKKEQFVHNWEKEKVIGFVKYSFSNGLAFGLLLFVAMSIYSLFGESFSEVFLSKKTIFFFLTCFLAGIVLYGPIVWFINQFFYKKYKKDLS